MLSVVSPIFILSIVSESGSGMIVVDVLIAESCGDCQSVICVVVIFMELTLLSRSMMGCEVWLVSWIDPFFTSVSCGGGQSDCLHPSAIIC